MDISDIDKKLDMKGKLEIIGESDIFRWSKLYGINMTVFIRYGSTLEDSFFKIFVSKPADDDIYKGLISTFSGLEQKSYIVITRSIMDKKIIELITGIIKIPSVYLSEMTIENGKLILRLRFNHNFSQDMSSLLTQYLYIPYFIDNILIKKSEGLKLLMVKKNARVPLSILKYSVPLSLFELDPGLKSIAESECIMLISNMDLPDNRFDVSIFSKEKLEVNERIKPVMRIENMYRYENYNKFMIDVKIKANDHGIFRNDETVVINGNELYVTLTIAQNQIMDYIEMLFASSMKYFKKNVITLKTVAPFDENLF